MLVANAYLVNVLGQMVKVAQHLGEKHDSVRFASDFCRTRDRFNDVYVSKVGRTVSDSQTALALALHFDLLSPDQRLGAISRLQELVRANVFKVGTGFAGTPIILDVLAGNGMLSLAYRMLQEKQCPGMLYCVSQGATTIVSSGVKGNESDAFSGSDGTVCYLMDRSTRAR
jgi:alpha-L-rhamnosidase